MDDVGLDPFSGSGTTLITAVTNNRKGIGIDVDCKYCKRILESAEFGQGKRQRKNQPLIKNDNRPSNLFSVRKSRTMQNKNSRNRFDKKDSLELANTPSAISFSLPSNQVGKFRFLRKLKILMTIGIT